MLITDPRAFRDAAARTQADRPPTPRGIFLVEPAEFRLEAECARDNHYMRLAAEPDPGRALRQFRNLARAIADVGLPAVCFPGNPDTPDAVFPNNVFATIPGRAIVGNMFHPTRKQEADRPDIRRFFSDVMRYETVDLSIRDCVAELTGALIIDRRRGLGFCGMTDRVDEAGAAAMDEAFRLAATFRFDLRPGEYHTNVVMSVLAGRVLVLEPEACTDPAAADTIIDCFPDHVLLDNDEVRNFAGNCLAVTDRDLFLSARALDGLRPTSRAALEHHGFRFHAVDVSELEKSGGSVRCMLGEIF